MKIGVIADIHADYDSLKLALDFFTYKQVDDIICAGDLVDKGFEPNKVVDHIQSDSIPTVQGNHDTVPEDPYKLRHDIKAYLEELPNALVFRWEQRTVYLTHGAPWSNWEYVFPTSKALMPKIAQTAAADVVILGHTHMPMIAYVEHELCWILNPGAVSRYCSQDVPTCGILTIPADMNRSVNFRVYDLDTWQHVKLSTVTVSAP